MLTNGPRSNQRTTKAFVIEDTREACADLRNRGYTCDRITHNELMTAAGTEYLGALLSGDYVLLWIGTPADWYVRTPGKKSGPHFSRIQNLMTKARKLRMKIIMFGPPGYVWKLAPIHDAIEVLNMNTVRMRLCHFGLRYNMHDKTPSGTYMQVATTIAVT